MRPTPRIDYEQIVKALGASTYDTLAQHLSDILPERWCKAYDAAALHQTNVIYLFEGSFEYFFDFSTELVRRKALTELSSAEDRVVVAHGRSPQSCQRRPRSARIRGVPRGAAQVVSKLGGASYDRGHFISHAIGGSLNVNIFAQLTALNRGRSREGKMFRSMERYCLSHPGTYCFVRPSYAGLSAHPAVLEVGVLREDCSLWVESFQNTTDKAEMTKIERLLNEKRQAAAWGIAVRLKSVKSTQRQRAERRGRRP